MGKGWVELETKKGIQEGRRGGEGRELSLYRMTQPPLESPLFFTVRATRAASVKASLTPRFFMAEHSVMCKFATWNEMRGAYRDTATP